MNIHKGLFRYHRLAYGVSTSPAVFQHTMDQILQGIDDVVCFMVDIWCQHQMRKHILQYCISLTYKADDHRKDKLKDKLLGNLFVSYGLPKVLVLDNGPQFMEFEQFLKGNGVCPVLSLPYHPTSNGAAERAVQTFKKAWTRMQSQLVSPSQRLARFVFTYRNTPHTVTEHTPAVLFLKRQSRTHLSLIKPDVSDVVSKHQLQQQKVNDKKSKSLRAFSLRKRVFVRDFRHPKKL
ncbi:hypothetical protein QQF64_003219 [Cirrhinus molitorella]|uniref:Integrase catalytic domain-containing protein n=1 Tax=Cirrhinus molitorella TaxID=172907 RepID=A0ABR3MJD6_9TELE